MILRITINCDNAAFEERGEASRILRTLAIDLEGLSADSNPSEFLTQPTSSLRDSNGNKVGFWTLLDKETEA